MAGGCSKEGSSSNNAGGCQFEPSDEQQLPPALNSRPPSRSTTAENYIQDPTAVSVTRHPP